MANRVTKVQSESVETTASQSRVTQAASENVTTNVNSNQLRATFNASENVVSHGIPVRLTFAALEVVRDIGSLPPPPLTRRRGYVSVHGGL